MPELPEVETIARTLKEGGQGLPGLVGRTVAGAEVFWGRTVAEPSPAVFKKAIAGQRVEDVGRRAKYLRFTLSEDTLLVHLRMSGDLQVGRAAEKLGEHIRLAVYFEDGLQLAFNDPRKFGRVWLVRDPQEVLASLGPEPFDERLTPEEFFRMLQKRSRQIKPLLLDQSFIAGVGNIYADEALNLAKIHPRRRADTLSEGQAGSLLEAVRRVLVEGIRRNGASIDWVYRGGDFQNYFRVYQQAGEPCPHCATPIERMVVGQRGTYYCPACQVDPR